LTAEKTNEVKGNKKAGGDDQGALIAGYSVSPLVVAGFARCDGVCHTRT
jgi:hypothetical protein